MGKLADLLLEADVVPDTKFKKQLEKAVKYLNTKGKILILQLLTEETYPQKISRIHLNLPALLK